MKESLLLLLYWDADIENLKLVVIAPAAHFENAGLDAAVWEQVKRLNCEVIAAYLNLD